MRSGTALCYIWSMTFLTEHQTESLLAAETRQLTATNGARLTVEALAVEWAAFDELVRPPISMDRFELIDRALAWHDETGEGLSACLQRVVTIFHRQLAPPWALKVVPRVKGSC